MDNWQESTFNNDAAGIDMNPQIEATQSKQLDSYRGAASPDNPILIRLIETKVTVEHQHANWKLREIKEVPLPQPSFKLNIENNK